MAGSVNKVILLGNVGRDPEVRTFNDGGRIVSFSLATSESWRDKATGERKSKSFWHNIVIQNEGVGKIAEQYVRKGSKIFVEGQLQSRDYTDKDGNKRYVTEVVLPRFGGSLTLLDGPSDRGGASDQKDDAPRSSGPLSVQLDDDVPFMMEWR